MSKQSDKLWQPNACILCSLNCGIEVNIKNRHLINIRGDKKNPKSHGYVCQKASRLNYYQNHTSRLTHPLRRKRDGAYEKISWDTAIQEIAQKLVELRTKHGGHSIAYYGGGGQGNHLNGSYSTSLRAALKTPYFYNSLAQEKTGDFWVNGKLFGRQSCHVAEDVENSDFVIIIGTNPWQAHGIPQARKTIRTLAKDPTRTLVVIDPRRTETADLADVHLQVKPGTDAFLLAAMLGVIVQEGREDNDFLNTHTKEALQLIDQLKAIPVDEFIHKTGLDLELVKEVARGFSATQHGCIRADLGIQQSLHSTLNSYLEKLLFLITGNFGKPGTNNLHTQFLPLIGHSNDPEHGGISTRVTQMRAIAGLFPPNILPNEINNDHPERIRALIVDSHNPILTAADSNAYEEAFSKLELSVVIDVANTETARLADYVLPAQTQFEKWEATFFTLEFPINYFHLRRPVLKPEGDTLPEPEIYRRILVAMGDLPDKFPFLSLIAKIDRRVPFLRIFPTSLNILITLRPKWKKLIPIILYSTLGKYLPEKAKSAALLWAASLLYVKRYRNAVARRGRKNKFLQLSEDLFRDIIKNHSGVIISHHNYDEVWQLVLHPNNKIHIEIPELISQIDALRFENTHDNRQDFPFVLAAGERRSYNANQIYRDPAWRKKEFEGALKIHPDDATVLGLQDGVKAVCESQKDSIIVYIQKDKSIQRGFVSLPHGYGSEHPDATTEFIQHGPKINKLTSLKHCDPISKTPFHKYIPVRIYAL